MEAADFAFLPALDCRRGSDCRRVSFSKRAFSSSALTFACSSECAFNEPGRMNGLLYECASSCNAPLLDDREALPFLPNNMRAIVRES